MTGSVSARAGSSFQGKNKTTYSIAENTMPTTAGPQKGRLFRFTVPTTAVGMTKRARNGLHKTAREINTPAAKDSLCRFFPEVR